MKTDKKLLKKLKELGYPLFEPDESYDANSALAKMAQSRDLRLWEGFPVVLANSAEKGLFDYKLSFSLLKSKYDRFTFVYLVTVSLALYRVLDLGFSWADGLYYQLKEEDREKCDEFMNNLKLDKDLVSSNRTLSGQRLKAVFNSYFRATESGLADLVALKEEHSLEYSLSRLFSPKQKELFLKKLKREKLTKTEKEYFSRVVKKKVLALANPELHCLALKVLE